jgi:thiosulfate dehydrogenase
MFKGLILGILLTAVIGLGGIYFYFSTGRAPVATSAPPMPLERKLASLGLHSYLDKLPHPAPQVPANEETYLAGAHIYKENCAVCHGLPGGERTRIAAGMFPKPPQLFEGMGVTDDEPWETYWKAENGIRMTGMPAFKDRLSEKEIWQVTVFVKNADKISDSAKAVLTGVSAAPPSAPPAATPKKEAKPAPHK